MTRSLIPVFCICFALSLAGCKGNAGAPPQPTGAAPVPTTPAPPTPIAEKKAELGSNTWDPQWDAAIEQAIPVDMLSPVAAKAVKSYCPRFETESEQDKRAFWAYFFQALSGAEAGLVPDIDVRHAKPGAARTDPVSKRAVRQEGLMQLTYEDTKRYGCDFDWQHDRTLPEKDPSRSILQPSRNLACGIRIVENQIITQQKPLIVRSSYWSTLRPGTRGYRVFAKQMANVPATCGTGTALPGKHGARR
jgi:hypothetical protein